MAKKEAAKPAKETKKAAPAEAAKYGVTDLADMLDIDPATARIKLRNAGIKKTSRGGASYGWDTKEDLKAVADKISAKKTEAKKAEKTEAKKAPAKDEKKAEKASTKKDAPAKDTKKAANDKGAKKTGKKAA